MSFSSFPSALTVETELQRFTRETPSERCRRPRNDWLFSFPCMWSKPNSRSSTEEQKGTFCSAFCGVHCEKRKQVRDHVIINMFHANLPNAEPWLGISKDEKIWRKCVWDANSFTCSLAKRAEASRHPEPSLHTELMKSGDVRHHL